MLSDSCAECTREIGVEHRLPGPREFGWYSEMPPPAAVLARCPACLAISASWAPAAEEYPGGSLPRPGKPELWIGSADVNRAIETLRAFEARGELREGFLQLRHSRQRSAMLRVPEVFAVARGAFGALASPMRQGAFRVTGRQGVWFPRTPDPVVYDSYLKWPDQDGMFRVRPGDPSILLPTYYPRPHVEGPMRDDDVPQVLIERDSDDPFARIERSHHLRVVRGAGVFLEVVPLESSWVASGVLRCLRMPLDHAIPVEE